VVRPLFLDQSGALGGAELYLLDLARAYRSTGHVLLFDDGPFADRLRAEALSVEVRPAGRALQSIRKETGLGAAPVVGVFSRLAAWKGQHVLVEAIARLRPLVEQTNLQVLLVGDALFGGDRTYADALRAIIAAHGLTDRVHFLGFRDDVPALLRVCDVVVHTSTAPEPFGRVIVEGMLAERPVVATRAGGATEIITDSRTGRLVPPGDPQALAAALGDLLGDPGRSRRLARTGAEHARSAFGQPAMIQGIDDVLRTVTGRPPTDQGSFSHHRERITS